MSQISDTSVMVSVLQNMCCVLCWREEYTFVEQIDMQVTLQKPKGAGKC